MDENRLVLRVADDFEGFHRILVLRVSETHWYMNVANTVFSCHFFFVPGSLSLHSEIDYRFDPVLREYVDVVIRGIGAPEYSIRHLIEIIELEVALNILFRESVLFR